MTTAHTPTAMSIRVAELVLDWTLYPRHHIDEQNVRALRHAYEIGEELPPIDVDHASLRVVDGFHRVTMYQRVDPNLDVQIVRHRYPDDSAIFLDAVRRNARHGARLSPYDQARCVALAERLHVDEAAIAGALGVSVDVAAKIRVSRTAYNPDGEPLQLKRSLRHLAGRTLDARQVDVNTKASGWSIAFHAEQIVALLEADAVDWTDDRTVHALHHLADILTRALADRV